MDTSALANKDDLAGFRSRAHGFPRALRFQPEHAGENVAGLAGTQEGARYQGGWFEVTREACRQALRLQPPCFRQRDFIGFREMAAHVRLGLAVTNEDDAACLLGLHAFRYTRWGEAVCATPRVPQVRADRGRSPSGKGTQRFIRGTRVRVASSKRPVS